MSQDDSNTNKNKQTERWRRSRRSVLRSVGAGAIGSVGLTRFESNMSERDSTRIPIKEYKGETKYKEVPTKWYDHYKQAKTARFDLEQVITGVNSLTRISLGRGDSWIKDARKFKIKVGLSDMSHAGNIPESHKGIPVETLQADEGGPTDACYNSGDWSTVYGGIDISDDTLGVVVEYSGKKMAMTNHHVIANTNDCTADEVGQDVYLYPGTSDEKFIGTVHSEDVGLDMALVEIENNNLTPTNKILEPGSFGGTPIEVTGYTYESGVASLLTWGGEIKKTGTATGTNTGQVTDMYVSHSDCHGWDGHGVETDIITAPGDSGSSVYQEGGDEANLVSLHNWHTGSTTGNVDCEGDTYYSKSVGSAIYEINNKWNITWDW